MKISAVVLTRNEENNISSCLKSISFCDEIIVVDDYSVDSTVSIAKNLEAKVFLRRMNKDYSAQSNFGMEKAGGDWILFIDADERVSNGLENEILQSIKKKVDIKGYYLKRIDYLWGIWLTHGEVGSVRLMRLVKKGSGKWFRRVHPDFQINGRTQELYSPLLHYPHPSLSKFVDKINRWSSWHALANKEESKTASLSKIVFAPVAKFVVSFMLKRGFLDGERGLLHALVMSFHSYLSWSKLWLMQRKK